MKTVEIYTDGACSGNPGPGGYGVVLLHRTRRKELSGGYSHTTNNRMELMAAIVGLRALKQKCKVRLHSDSQYVVNAMTKGWAETWRKNDWKRNRKEKASNADLWAELLELAEKHDVEFVWVPSHSGIPENERADRLSVKASQQPDLPPDPGYNRVMVD
ncbi:ribonuclease HI [bacterium]|nr:ribonuclease HI [bacterium]